MANESISIRDSFFAIPHGFREETPATGNGEVKPSAVMANATK